MQDFSQFRLFPGTLDAIAAKGYETPSPIQVLAIPPVLDGRDLIALAQTGTGKTAAFGVPLVDAHRERHDNTVIALVLVPTRELAIQVAEELDELAAGSALRVVAIYGGAGFGNQLDALGRRGAKILVATPGRLLDHMERGTVRLDRIETLVLDEADRMLDMGFVRDVERIMKDMPKKRQTLLFSATMPKEVRRLSERYLDRPFEVKVEAKTATADLVEQFRLRAEKGDKQTVLIDVLHAELPERAIVFTRTKHLARRLAERLDKGGWSSVALQGNMTQGQRERALTAFRQGDARILVATDVAARGLDIPEVSHIVNFDLPDGADAYVHRIGRTARMGRAGRAFTFVQSDEARDMRDIERATGARIDPFHLEPSLPERPGPDPVKSRERRPVEHRPEAPRRGGQGGYGGGGGGRGNGGGRRTGGGGRGGPRRSGGGRRQGGGGSGGRPRSAGRPRSRS
ncbi:MAG: DEAD/DEAH box helicase [Euryarchaeota archaeon]|nr:DEAD/DEAH box helicase [Euryarchaeota archaeon]